MKASELIPKFEPEINKNVDLKKVFRNNQKIMNRSFKTNGSIEKSKPIKMNKLGDQEELLVQYKLALQENKLNSQIFQSKKLDNNNKRKLSGDEKKTENKEKYNNMSNNRSSNPCLNKQNNIKIVSKYATNRKIH